MAVVKGKVGALGYSTDSGDYKPQVSGLANIRTGEKKARITFLDPKYKWDNETNEKVIELSELPKYPKLHPNTEGTYRVRLTKDADEIESLFAAEGHFYAKIVDFGGRKGDPTADPAPYEKWYHKGEKDEEHHLEFVVTYKVIEGSMKGATIPLFLHYKFEEDPGNPGFTKWKGNPENQNASRLFQLMDWCDKHHLVDEPIVWPEDGNILPELLSRALENDDTVELLVKNGMILKDGLMSAQKDEEPEEDEKPAAKSKSKAADPDEEESSDERPLAKAAAKAYANGKSKTKAPPASSKDEDLD